MEDAEVPTSRQISVGEPLTRGSGIDAVMQVGGLGRILFWCLESLFWCQYPVISSNGVLAQAGVPRTYADFTWLHEQLVSQYPGSITPPLPESLLGAGGIAPLPEAVTAAKVKNAQEGGGGTDGFLLSMLGGEDYAEKRRARLEGFLRRTDEHPLLRKSRAFALFLEAAEVEFAEHKKGSVQTIIYFLNRNGRQL
jgi:hypothetical protein